MIIYKTINEINGKIYVGKDINNNPNYFGSGLLIKRAIKKYGKENFRKEIIEECESLEQLNKKEIYWIAELNPEYNIAKGGDGGYLLRYADDDKKQRTYKKISESLIGREILWKDKISKALENKPKTKEHKQKIKEKRKLQIITEEHKNNISKALKGCKSYKRTSEWKKNMSMIMSELMKGVNNPMYGRKQSEKTKKIISDKTKGKWIGEKSPLSKLSNKQRNEIVKLHNTGIKKTELAKMYEVSISTIRRTIRRGKYE